MNKDPIRCDECGKFVPERDINSGKAYRQEIILDHEFDIKEWETLCKRCNRLYQAKLENQILVTTD